MKRYVILLISLLAGIHLSGCIPSLHPVYTEKDLVFMPELLGTWTSPEGSDTWEFSRASDIAYSLVQTDDQGSKGEFTVHLAKIKGQLFMDCFPGSLNPEFKDRINGFYLFHYLPVHMVLHVRQITPKLQLSLPNPDWLKTYLTGHPDAIAHEITEDDRIVLTASTKDLQQFWLTHLNTDNAFNDPSNMTKKETR